MGSSSPSSLMLSPRTEQPKTVACHPLGAGLVEDLVLEVAPLLFGHPDPRPGLEEVVGGLRLDLDRLLDRHSRGQRLRRRRLAEEEFRQVAEETPAVVLDRLGRLAGRQRLVLVRLGVVGRGPERLVLLRLGVVRRGWRLDRRAVVRCHGLGSGDRRRLRSEPDLLGGLRTEDAVGHPVDPALARRGPGIGDRGRLGLGGRRRLGLRERFRIGDRGGLRPQSLVLEGLGVGRWLGGGLRLGLGFRHRRGLRLRLQALVLEGLGVGGGLRRRLGFRHRLRLRPQGLVLERLGVGGGLRLRLGLRHRLRLRP